MVAGTIYWLYARQYESTDDAFIDGDIVQISPRWQHMSLAFPSNANQYVHKGDLLVELDPSDLQAKLDQAKAQLQAARASAIRQLPMSI